MDLLGVFEMSHGSMNTSLVSAEAIYRRALLCGANIVILVHNHPSGYAIPSADDMRKVLQVGRILEMEPVDHAILGGDYYSYHEAGKLGVCGGRSAAKTRNQHSVYYKLLTQ